MPVRYHRRMPKDEKMTEPVLVRLKPSMAQLVDAWRRDQVDLPTRAEAIRRLAAMALQAIRAEKPATTGKGAKKRD
jgi:hypothetical protein